MKTSSNGKRFFKFFNKFEFSEQRSSCIKLQLSSASQTPPQDALADVFFRNRPGEHSFTNKKIIFQNTKKTIKKLVIVLMNSKGKK